MVVDKRERPTAPESQGAGKVIDDSSRNVEYLVKLWRPSNCHSWSELSSGAVCAHITVKNYL